MLTTYGFAISAVRSDLHWPQDFGCGGNDGSLGRASAGGTRILVRHYPNTPESVTEDQPLVRADLVLAYEGRVDNRAEVALALNEPGLTKGADGAVLAAAYRAWGDELSAKVIGEYSFVVLDREKRRLVGGHDSLGVRRLWYRTVGERVWITSNLAFLFEQFPDARPAFDREVLPEYFAGTMSPWSGRTIWRGIRELPPGAALVHDGTKAQERSVWRPREAPPVRFRSDEELDESFRALIFDAVRHALRSVAPVLADLSGGYDSSTTCAVASVLVGEGHGHNGIVGWSTVSKRSNEAEFQEAVRSRYGIELHALPIEGCLPFQAFDDTQLPSGSFIQCGAMNRAMREFADARGLRSRMTGHGADALLHKGVQAPVYLAEWLRAGRIADWARHFAGYLRSGAFSAWHLLRDCSLGTLDVHAGQFRSPQPDWLTSSFRSEIGQAEDDFRRLRTRAFTSHARERVYRFTQCFIPQHGQMLPDERMPLLHRPLVEFMLSLDWEHLARPGEDRILMRRALRGILPDRVRAGRADGRHGASIYAGLRAAWPGISHLITGESLAEMGVVKPEPFRRALARMRAGFDGPNSQYSRTALYLEAWLGFKAMRSTATWRWPRSGPIEAARRGPYNPDCLTNVR